MGTQRRKTKRVMKCCILCFLKWKRQKEKTKRERGRETAKNKDLERDPRS